MARTHRSLPKKSCYCYFRKPKTSQEIRKLKGLLNDLKLEDSEYKLSGVNRMHRYIPTAWDDIVISAYYEQDFKFNH
jgi:hypothetical protein